MKLVLFIAALFLRASAQECGYKSIKEFAHKISGENPVTKELELRAEAFEAIVERSAQRPNPQIEFEWSQFDGDDGELGSLKLLHTVETGGKRQARIDESKALASLKKKEFSLSSRQLAFEALLTYQRAAQLEVLVEAMEEARSTFKRMIRKLSSRKRLNPEEKVSLSTLKLAMNDYTARLNDLKNEEELLAGNISFLVGCEVSRFKYAQPNFPAMEKFDLDKGSSAAAIETAKIELAQMRLNSENSLAYQNVAVGPILGVDQFEGRKEYSVGIGITFNAPFFHTNQGGKAQARKELEAQRRASSNTLQRLEIRLQKQLKIYNQSLGFYRKMPALNEISNYHQEAERLFSRGVVAIPMIIESHRQHVDYLDSRFETENDILQALKEVYLLSSSSDLVQNLFL